MKKIITTKILGVFIHSNNKEFFVSYNKNNNNNLIQFINKSLVLVLLQFEFTLGTEFGI